ncbi:MAG TPA: flagellar hook-basal body complex protein FliE [Ruminiclostridium sp.]|jgi:flagellar hook-basal body complex protein FliE|nr:flagellar hook-basal body complex protein FliE [Ruminiclostridium sp.]
MNIQSIAGLNAVNAPSVQQTASGSDATSMFKDIYDGLVGNVNTTNEAFEGDMVKAAEGELDNPHQLLIDSSKANIALQLLLTVRNNALDAYNEVIKMSV